MAGPGVASQREERGKMKTTERSGQLDTRAIASSTGTRGRRYAGEAIGGAADAGTLSTATAVLQGTSGKGRLARLLPFIGPAFIACIAYMDPGNFATNIQGGAQFGYLLVWVIVASNLMAMLIQALSAKLGIATGR